MGNDVNKQNDNDGQKHVPQPDPGISPDKKKEDEAWITGTEPMTREEKFYLKKLSEEAGEEFDENMSRAAALTRIGELEHKMREKPGGEEK